MSVDISSLCFGTAQSLWALYHCRGDAPYLILPLKRDESRRVSEQESKILIAQWLNDHRHHYSIETPTLHSYQQTGQASMSARIDVTVYASSNPKLRALNIELKAGTATVEAFRKDFEKLLRESTPGLWFHTLEFASDAAWRVLRAKMTEALARVGAHADVANHTIHFAFCVLDDPHLVEFEVNFSQGWRDRIGPALDAGRGRARRPGWRFITFASHKPVTKPKKVLRPSYSGAQRKLLVRIPSIAGSTFLHLSIKGESYALRSYVGPRGYVRWKADDCATTSELLVKHPIAKQYDVASERQSLDGEKAYWVKRITELNRKHGIG